MNIFKDASNRSDCLCLLRPRGHSISHLNVLFAHLLAILGLCWIKYVIAKLTPTSVPVVRLLARDAQAKLALIVAQCLSIHLSICVSVRHSLSHAYVRSIARREPPRLPAGFVYIEQMLSLKMLFLFIIRTRIFGMRYNKIERPCVQQ